MARKKRGKKKIKRKMKRARTRKIKAKPERVRRVKKKEVKREISYSQLLVVPALTIVTLIFLVFIMYTIPKSYTGLDQRKTQITPAITQSGGYCIRNSECFVVSCESIGILECLNTTQMTNYYKKCRGWWEVKIETQTPSRCACIQNGCRVP